MLVQLPVLLLVQACRVVVVVIALVLRGCRLRCAAKLRARLSNMPAADFILHLCLLLQFRVCLRDKQGRLPDLLLLCGRVLEVCLVRLRHFGHIFVLALGDDGCAVLIAESPWVILRCISQPLSHSV